MSLLLFTALIAIVAVERLAELVLSKRNAAWSLRQGGVESGQRHYVVMVVLHTGLLVGALAEAWLRRPDVPPVLAWSMLTLVLASQALRWWCITTLGPRWNTRVIIVPGLAPVRSGPYRLFRHPNYVAVVVEGTMPEERTVLATLATLADELAAHRVRPPAIIVVGEVVAVAHPAHYGRDAALP